MEKFKSSDYSLLAYLSLVLDIFPIFERLPSGRYVGVLDASHELFNAMNRYNGGAPVCAVEFSERVKVIKGLLYDAKRHADCERK